MIQISALNDSSSDESDAELQYESTKEAQESNGFALYNKALGLQRTGNHPEAERVFHQLLNTRLLMNAEPPEDPEKPGGLVQPGLILKYSTYKNLGSIAFQRHDLNTAMENYLEAASLDSTDVTLWFKIGTVAVDLHHLPLARVAFQQGLTCNQKHWPCLDHLCTVLYALNDYATCLYYICKALERDYSYTKGLALRDQIFSEQPSFRKDSYHMFRHCNDYIHNAKVKKEDADKVIKEALTLREKKRALEKKPESPVLKFLSPLKKFTWKDVGEQLIALYDYISDRTPQLSIGCTIDIPASLRLSDSKMEEDNQSAETPMDVVTTEPPTAPTSATSNSSSATSQEIKPPAAVDAVAGETQPFVTTETSSRQADAASVVPGQSQDQVHGGTDGSKLQDTRYDTEQGQGDAGVNHMTNEQQLQQQQRQEEQLQPTAPGEPPSALEFDTTTQATTDQPILMETDEAPLGKQKKRRGPKRKRDRIELLDEPYGGKRRSARVRNTTKKKEETVSVNYAELLQRFLPSSLTDSEVDEDPTSQDGMVTNQDETITQNAEPTQEDAGKPCDNDTSQFTSTEEEDVREFLKEHEDNSGVLDLLHYYLVSLAKKYNLKWPTKLTEIYVKGFERLRKHCCFPQLLSSDTSEQYQCGVGEMLLVYAELKMDQWLIARGKVSSTPKKSSSLGSPDYLADFPGEFFEEDLGYVEDLAHLPPLIGAAWRTFAVRANWMKSRFLILQGKPEVSVDFFDECAYLLTSEETKNDADKTSMTVTLPNCIQDNIITKDKIEHQKKSLERCQSLEEVQRLHKAEDYKRVVHLLLPTVLQPSMGAARGKTAAEAKGGSVGAVPERHAQLELLHQALLKLEDYSKCLACGAASLAETWQELLLAKSGAAREEWTSLLIQILEVLDKSMSQGISVLSSVERSRLVQLTSTLINIIEHAMEGAEMEAMQPLTTVLPWIVLYRLIKLQEDKLTAIRIASPRRSISPVPMMSSSLMLLETAHEYLGRHSWCCNSEGALLKLYVNVLQTEMVKVAEEESHPFQDDLQLALEQCFYCLYAHPNRRSKARHLQDHGVEEVPLKWEAAAFLFDYFKPKVVPEFDSYKANSMSADLESLFLKISKSIPEEENLANAVDAVQAYMEGNSETAPSLPQDKRDNRPVIKEIHYFLADFYFKNKEFGKAIRFYNLDICVCPNRLDSWAGAALARGGRLDLKLNSCDSKTETPIYKNSIPALRSFKRALEIDETNLALWIEYGSLAYTLHSHASRQLKQHVHPRLSDDTVELLREKRKEMLELAGHCFLKASECEEDGEEWLVQYMLGKVAEKRQTEPGVYLGHYLEAANHLYENEAKYPKKITYHNPPDLALEALEMYYRLHASILKLLERRNKEGSVDYGVLNEFVLKAADTPFVKAKEKKNNTDQSDMSSNEFESSDGKSSSDQRSRLSSSGNPMSPAYMTPQDHDYVKKKKKRNVSQETLSTETASEGEILLSGDDTTNSSFGQSYGTAQLLKSLAELKNKDTTTTTENSTSEGLPTETESSQDENPCSTVADEGQGMSAQTGVGSVQGSEKDAQLPSQNLGIRLVAAPKRPLPVPMALTKVCLEDPSMTEVKVSREDEPITGESESEPDIIDLISDSSDSPVMPKPKIGTTPKVGKVVAEKKTERKNIPESKNIPKSKNIPQSKNIPENKETVVSSAGKEDFTFIDLTLDSSDGESLTSTPPKRALHESPIKVKPPSSLASKAEVERKVAGGVAEKTTESKDVPENKDDVVVAGASGSSKKEPIGTGGDDVQKVPNEGSSEPMDIDNISKADQKESVDGKSVKLKVESKQEEPMEVDAQKEDKISANKMTAKDADKNDKSKTSKPAAETATGATCERSGLIDRCIAALGLCLSRFPQHYKSLYRLAKGYCVLDSHKNLQWSRDLLLGCTTSSWQMEDHMPSPALFGEHSKTKNLFQGIWRIPITDIDRSGSFPWHMYRSVILLLEVLEHLQDHLTLLQVSMKLNKIPEQGKKYLRDTDRQYLSQQSYQLCLAVLQHQLSEATTSQDTERKLNALLAAHKVWQCVQSGKLQADPAVPGNILRDAYKAYGGSQVESEPSVLEQAVRFCAYYNMVHKIPQTPTQTTQQGDLSFLGKSPGNWCGSPVRGSQSDTRLHIASPSIHDSKTTPEFPVTMAPKKATMGGGAGEGSVSQDMAANQLGRKGDGAVVGPHRSSSLSGLYSLPPTDFQGAYKESLMLKPKEAVRLSEPKMVKKVTSTTSLPSQPPIAKVAATTQPNPSTQAKVSAQQKGATYAKDAAGVKISSVTGKPIVKLRTLSSQAKTKPSPMEAGPIVSKMPSTAKEPVLSSQSKYFDSAKIQRMKPVVVLEKTSPVKANKILQSDVQSKQLTSSAQVARRVPMVPLAGHRASLSQSSLGKSATPVTAASADVVQKLREALGSRQQVDSSAKGKTFTSKLSLHREHTKGGDGSIGSHSNKPVSTVSMPLSNQGNRPLTTASMPTLDKQTLLPTQNKFISHSNKPVSIPQSSHGNKPVKATSMPTLDKHCFPSQSKFSSQSNKPVSMPSSSQGNRPVSAASLPTVDKHSFPTQSKFSSHSNKPVSMPSSSQRNRPVSAASLPTVDKHSFPTQSKFSSHSNKPVSMPSTIQGNRQVSAASMPTVDKHSFPTQSKFSTHSEVPASSGGQVSSSQEQQQKEGSSKEAESKQPSNFMSSFLSFLGGSK